MVNDKRKLAKKHYNKGLDLVWQKQDKEAIKEFKQAIKLFPELPGVHYDLGLCYEDKGKIIEAFKEYEEELRINPDNLDAHNNLGRMYALQGNKEEAIRQFELVLKLDANYEGAKKNLELAGKERDYEDSFKIQEDTNQVTSHPADTGFPLRSNKSQVTKPETRNLQLATISLCMIVKNEEECLPRCLDSVKDLVDEIIIVDTGSTDKTVEIAKSYGAKVYYSKWCNDFSAARNETLKYPTKDWIFSIDADEYIDEENKEKLIKLLQNPTHQAYFINIKSILSEDATYYSVNALERLYKNLPGICYTGKIHNQIAPSLKKLGIRTKRTDIFIYHTGYILSLEGAKKKYKRGIKRLREWIKLSPDNPMANFYIATLYLSIRKYNLAIKHYYKVINFVNVPSYIRSISYLRLTSALIDNGLFDEALKICERAIKLYPGEYIFRTFSGIAYTKKQDYADAIKEFEIVLANVFNFSRKHLLYIEIHPSVLHILLGEVYEKKGDLEKATYYYQQAIEKKPDYSAPYIRLANLYFKQFNYDLAIDEYKKAIDLKTQNPGVYLNLGVAYLGKDELNSAISTFRKTIDLDPNFVSAYTNLSVVYRRLGQWGKAIKELETALKLRPRDIPTLEENYSTSQEGSDSEKVFFDLGNLLIKNNEFKEAEKSFQNSISLNPDSTEAYNNLGLTYLFQKSYAEALRYLQKAVELDSSNINALKNLAICNKKLGNEDLAIAILARAKQLIV